LGDPASATCAPGAPAGGACVVDDDCAPGLGCIFVPCNEGANLPQGCADNGHCGSVSWAAAGQPCDYLSTRCLVDSCVDTYTQLFGAPADGGPFPGTCPLVVSDGQSRDTGAGFSTCDTFSMPFSLAAGDAGLLGNCTLYDSVVCR
jgi:hypothetical protein